MQVTFGRIIPVKAYIDKAKADKQQTADISNILCGYLEKRDYYPNHTLAEQQRRFFASQVADYQLPKGAYCPHDNAKSAVLPFSVEDERYLATGEDITWVKTYGYEYGSDRKKANTLIDKNLKLAIRGLYEQCEMWGACPDIEEKTAQLERDAQLQKEATTYQLNQKRIAKLRALVNNPDRKIDKTLNIMASFNPKAEKDKEAYTISLIDFKA